MHSPYKKEVNSNGNHQYIPHHVIVSTMAVIRFHCHLCGKKLSENHLCLPCSGCNQHIPSTRLHHHRRLCIRAGTGKASKGVKIPTRQPSSDQPGNVNPHRPLSPQPGPSRIVSPQPGPSRVITPEPPRVYVNGKNGDSDSEVHSEREDDVDFAEAPHIISRREIFQGGIRNGGL
ncbi:uncharacterized protein LOC119597574 [Penaeus monodon]|uniref:uncharacterized protein LOC119597574 n=1 Tax=Penaeus monodon TaxID=6687 RepID=UPI0018A7095D|nr:uncharacterized protein LOC119597574 [Penaeus monodon]